MRVISQDGLYDLPYEALAIRFHEDDRAIIIGVPLSINIPNIKLGEYSTEAKAQKAMEMLQKEYGKHFYGQGGAMATANFYVPPFAFIPPKIFQFPKDEDLEV